MSVKHFIKALITLCMTLVCFANLTTETSASTEAVQSSYLTGSFYDGDGNIVNYSISIGGDTTNGVRTTAWASRPVKRTHYSVTAQFVQYGLAVTATSSYSMWGKTSGYSYSPYAALNPMTGVTSILSGYGNVYVQYLGTKNVSF